ncbi:hypothetical protein [Ferruginibacter profundus]
MKQQAIANTPLWLYYYPLLLRYAGYIIKNRDDAALLVKNVLYTQYSLYGLQHNNTTRRILKADTLHSCQLYLQLKIFNGAPVTIPFK